MVTLLPYCFAIQPLWAVIKWPVMLIFGFPVNCEVQTIILLIYSSPACTTKVQAVCLTISITCSLEKFKFIRYKTDTDYSTFIKPFILLLANARIFSFK